MKHCGKGRVRNRKAQMEMVGLVIIVILITLGMLFLAQFALKESPTKKIFTRKGLAYSSMSTLMKTTISGEVECVPGLEGNPIELGKDVLEDCAINRDYTTLMECGFSCKYRCQGQHSCDFSKELIAQLLNETLGRWHKNYEFRSEYVGEDFVVTELFDPISSGRGCSKRNRDSSGIFPIQVGDSGLVQSVLFICD